MTQCGERLGDSTCTREQGHSGPHGLEIEPGLVLGPFVGSETGKAEPTPFVCDCCQNPLVLFREGRTFACSHCDQRHIFGLNREHQSTIVARLYPAWHRMTPKLQREYVEHTKTGLLFHWAALHHLGLVPDQELRTAIDYVDLWAETKLEGIREEPMRPAFHTRLKSFLKRKP